MIINCFVLVLTLPSVGFRLNHGMITSIFSLCILCFEERDFVSCGSRLRATEIFVFKEFS